MSEDKEAYTSFYIESYLKGPDDLLGGRIGYRFKSNKNGDIILIDNYARLVSTLTERLNEQVLLGIKVDLALHVSISLDHEQEKGLKDIVEMYNNVQGEFIRINGSSTLLELPEVV